MPATTGGPGATAIRPFTIPVTPEAELEALRARLRATRWPDQELVTDHSQGVQLTVIQALARYWAEEHDWRRCEARLSALPHFVTEIDGLDIHFIHVRSEHQNALPVIITHGWPGSVIELLGMHTNMAGVVPAEVSAALARNVLGAGDGPPAGLSAEESRTYEQLNFFYTKGIGYGIEMITQPQTLYGIADSPVGLASWMINHDAASYADIADAFAGHPVGNLTRDEVLDNITFYWLTGTGISSARLYWENTFDFFGVKNVSLPAAVSVFPHEIYRAPRSWAERAYPKLIYFNEVDRGNHFAAWQEPALFAAELRAAFRSLR
jgi:Epoxide hydrolase N terminus